MLRFKTKSITPPNAVYVEPSTAFRVPWVTSFDDVLVAVRDHRLLHGIQLTEGWEAEVEHQLCMTLQVDKPSDWIIDTENPPVPRLVTYGRQMWAELHAYARNYPDHPGEHEKAEAQKWMNGWNSRIPNTDCNCSLKWAQTGLVPDLSGREAFLRWTILAHDTINRYLGKPEVDAEEMYQKLLQST